MGLFQKHHPEDRKAEGQVAEGREVRAAERAGEAGPDEPTEVPRRGWVAVLKGTGREFMDDELTDRAAALTYYGVLALFPALLVLVSVLALVGPSATHEVLDNVEKLAPGSVREILRTAVTQLQASRRTGGVVAVVALAGALWSASGYIAAFIRAGNAVYDIREGRPVWKTLPLRIGLTALMLALLTASAVIVVFTGPLAQRAGDLLGLGHTVVTVWSIVKWPVLVVLVSLMIALLYWAAPNVRGRGFRWVSPGSGLAVLLWLLLSGGFSAYVANFGSYNRTYGALAGVIVFLVWLWLSNLAILLGLEFDAELARERAAEGGLPRGEEPYVPPHDTRTWPDDEKPDHRDAP
ncbi:YihY/virulence factor BrkB family protein [Streptacidiphilus neutrinimicus]|uniref:YihY/virulence factor BrkB family protein n=1 Tax=Streptacidiphilus neutrinimicus TaxID=105420 RepID=UPI0009FEFDBF|nr:YihY/virulence factor BrkB family protein [Streptacidiphilus neutrinimicus]